MNYMVLSLLVVCGLQAGVKTDRPESRPSQELSYFKKAMRAVNDFMSSEALGYLALSTDNEQFIKTIIDDLKMQDYCIEIRGMSNHAKQAFGRTNAFVMPSIFFNKKSHSYLYVSEEWFETLPQDAKDGLIRHELMHLREDHVQQKIKFLLLSSLGAGILTGLINEMILRRVHPATQPIVTVGALLLIAKHSRSCEKEADIEAAKTMDNKHGLVDLFENIKDNTQDPESKYAFKRCINNFFEAILAPLSSHPELDERIEYIENL